MIRILHYGLSANLGGIETYLHKIYSNIDRNKYCFDFLITKGEEPCFYKEFTNMGSKFYSITSRSENPIKNSRELKDFFSKEKFDIIHCHMNSLSYIKPILYGLNTSSKVIVHSRNANTPKSRLTRLLHTVNSIKLPKNKIKMLAVSDYAGEWMFGKHEEFTVINNGVDTKEFVFNENSRKEIRHEYNLKGKYCVIHVGAFRSQKNHHFLVEVFNEVLKITPNSRLLLIGEGDLREEIENRISEMGISENVLLFGNRNDVPKLLAAADVFLFPSFYEGFPNAILEAQVSGLPCLISDTITSEVAVKDNCEFSPLSLTARQWAENLLDLKPITNRKLAYEKVVEKGLSIEKEIRKIEDIYSELIQN